VEKKFLPQVEQLLRSEIPGITALYVFDWRLRSAETAETALSEGEAMVDLNEPTSVVRPAVQVHVDQSPRAALHRIQVHCEDVDRLLQGRVRVINLWRPLRGPVQDYPLAVCDGSTICEDDLVECDQVRRKFFGATNYAHYNEEQKWYFLSNQQPDEAFLFKIFDSSSDVNASSCPHVSFKHPSCPRDALPRKSVEVRALVFTPN